MTHLLLWVNKIFVQLTYKKVSEKHEEPERRIYETGDDSFPLHSSGNLL